MGYELVSRVSNSFWKPVHAIVDGESGTATLAMSKDTKRINILVKRGNSDLGITMELDDLLLALKELGQA